MAYFDMYDFITYNTKNNKNLKKKKIITKRLGELDNSKNGHKNAHIVHIKKQQL